MAIIRCPNCSRRMSSLARSCPSCHEPIGELTDTERERLAYARWRKRLYQARNITYGAMTLVVVGMILWWLDEPQGLGLPIGTLPGVLLGAGLIVYIASWCWLAWLRFRGNPSKD
ncbi:MAG: hypothetical protein RQ741_04040 [Wenzhouxiangellaceae bacterium]|nr:hypothetical protein [Wenzhouxiangellaceae bacterium]